MHHTASSRGALKPRGCAHSMADGVGGLPPTVSPSATRHRWVSPPRDPSSTGPQRFLEKGDALIHSLNLAGWPVGSEWRTRRPCRVTNQLRRRIQ